MDMVGRPKYGRIDFTARFSNLLEVNVESGISQFESLTMAKKKKTSLAPVNRGFATTSQPKKPVPIVEEPLDPEPPVEDATKTATSEGTNGQAVKRNELGPKGQDDWEDELGLEEGIYQGYVERLQEKGEKEINRIIKVSLDPSLSSLE
jgi:hypothetical protein